VGGGVYIGFDDDGYGYDGWTEEGYEDSKIPRYFFWRLAARQMCRLCYTLLFQIALVIMSAFSEVCIYTCLAHTVLSVAMAGMAFQMGNRGVIFDMHVLHFRWKEKWLEPIGILVLLQLFRKAVNKYDYTPNRP
jgi:hypothetical protein